MARGRGSRRDTVAWGDVPSRSRTARGRTSRGSSSARDSTRNSAPSRHASGSNRQFSTHNQGKPPTGKLPQRRNRPLIPWNQLPHDVVTQSLLPFLVWHDTSALGAVSKAWATVVSDARDRHPQWKTTSMSGNSVFACLAALSKTIGRGGNDVLRFAPTFAMVTVAFANAQDARNAQTVWSKLVESVVSADLLPVGCALVGMLSGREETQGEESAAVTMTISVGHLAQTVVHTAVFDRKALRWSASGLTEELACPLVEDTDPNSTAKTSLFVWSTSAKPADVMLSLAKQWFPEAAVAGAVVSRADHAPSLMTYTRSVQTPRRSRVQAQRKMKSTTSTPTGVLSFPSTLLVRLHGKTFIRSMDLCSDRPMTPILKNEALSVMEDMQFTRQDIRIYDSVSIIDDKTGWSNTHSLSAIVEHFSRVEPHATTGTSIALVSGEDVDHIRRFLSTREPPSPESQVRSTDIRCIPLYVDQLGVVTSSDHWDIGHYGVVTIRRNAKELLENVEQQANRLHLDLQQAQETSLATLVFCSMDFDEGLSALALNSLRQCMSEAPSHNIFVDGEIGPVGAPHPVKVTPTQVQTRSICGFVVCYSDLR